MTDITDDLPRWDVTDLFPSVTSRAFVDAQERVGADVARLAALYDHHRVGADNASPTGIDVVLDATNDLQRRYATLVTYAQAFTSTDSNDATSQRVLSELRQTGSTITQLSARFAAWVGAAGADAMIGAGQVASDHAWPLRRAEVRSTRQMGPTDEHLYAELQVTGSSAWAQLFSDVTSKLEADVPGRGLLPMPAVRGLAFDPDPIVRRAGYDAELRAWPTVATSVAAAMNAIKGEANVVNRRRHWDDPLDASLYANSVDRPTFDAMQSAVVASLPDFRRWMRAKAAFHGCERLHWADLFAPLPFAPGSVGWRAGCDQVLHAFTAYSPSLGALARQAFADRWVDAAPRTGKRGGAFCASLVDDRSLVFLNWSGSAASVSTLAHELGHAYHNTQLAHRTPMQRQLPMALAETASIFCETLLFESGLLDADERERLALLDLDLQGATQVVVDIHSRFLFESALFERRRNATLSPGELCDLMGDAQQRAYGDGLDQSSRHEWMWAVKPHYYGSHFYNWPYTFGLLFGLGLYACYRQEPERFRSGYDDLLASVAMAPSTELGARFGIDLHDEAFWTASLDTLRARMAEYERLAATMAVHVPI